MLEETQSQHCFQDLECSMGVWKAFGTVAGLLKVVWNICVKQLFQH